jgi:isoleucyl-tRNA synthetase
MANALAKLGDELRFVLITSGASLHDFADKPAELTAAELENQNLAVQVAPAEGEKCVRCWHIVTDIGTNPAHAHICGRCVTNLPDGTGEVRHYA